MDKQTCIFILNQVERIYLPILKNAFGDRNGASLSAASLGRLLHSIEQKVEIDPSPAERPIDSISYSAFDLQERIEDDRDDRRLACLELRRAIDDGIEDLGFFVPRDDAYDETVTAFRAMVNPWIDILER